jgi:hypothetical protein
MEFYDQQQQSLDRLINSLNSTERDYYKARIDKLQRNITLKKEQLKLPSSAVGKKALNDKRKDLLGDKLLDIEKIAEIKKSLGKKDFTDVLKHHHANVYNIVNKAVKANTKTVSGETAEKAILTRASTVFKRSGKGQAQGYLNSHGLDQYEILPESTGEGLVLRNKNSGKVKISFRGTILPQELNEVNTTAGDIGTDLAVMTGFEDQTKQFEEADDLVKTVKSKYGNNLDELLGYSLGGAKSLNLGDKYGIDTTTYNPLIGKNNVQAQETSAKHTIHRTTEDMPSLGSGLIDRENVEVKSYYPLKSNMFNVKQHHELNNFIERGRPRYTQSHIENLNNNTLKQGAQVAEHALLNDMSNYIDDIEDKRPPLPRFGKIMTQAEKDRFDNFKEPNFTDFIHNVFNKKGNGVDTDSQGNLLPTARLSDKTSHGIFWQKAGGEFTAEEQKIFDEGGIPSSKPNLSNDDINRIVNSSPEERQTSLNNLIEQNNNTIDELNRATNASDIMPLRNSGQSIGFGASTGIGLLSGLTSEGLFSAGEALTGKKIDDSRDVRTGLVGGLGGYFTTRGIASLTGQVASMPELAEGAVVGSLASIASKEAGKFVAKKGGGRFAQQETSGATSGAVAGLGSALIAGSQLGAEAGIPLDAETLGMASVVGAAIGGGISALGYGLGQIGINI